MNQSIEYNSRFGGFWADRRDALSVLESKHQAGILTKDERELFLTWIKTGSICLHKALDTALVDEVNREVAATWHGKHPEVMCTYDWKGSQRCTEAKPWIRTHCSKMLDLYAHSEIVRKAIFNKSIMRFLSLLFERSPMVFQSLYFELGSQQAMHQDSAFVQASSPMEFVGIWIALEDIQPGSGELEYYTGSHLQPEFLWNGRDKGMPWEASGTPEHKEFLSSLHKNAEKYGYERKTHLPKKGDVLIWHADLSHGGSPRSDLTLTRKSFAVHACPSDNQPKYFQNGTPFTGPINTHNGACYCFEKHNRVPATFSNRLRNKIGLKSSNA